MKPSELIEHLEELATALDDGDHGKTPPATHIADIIGLLLTAYHEANDGE